MTDKKSYYAIIPASVRYDKRLTPNAKLLYGEITALCNERGFCWASNGYFAELYEVSNVSISMWIKALVTTGHITSQIERAENKQVLSRYLRIVNDPTQDILNTPIKDNLKDNTTRVNNTTNITKKVISHKYGDYKKVLLSDIQLSKLKEEFSDWEERIKRLDEYIATSGKSYKDHLAVIRVWSRKEQKTEKKRHAVL